jgi:galactokinase
MFASHDGLSKDYEVSCDELDFLVDFVRKKPEVIGARMMGGGFGGCTINIVKEEVIENLIAEISSAYKNKMKKDLTAYIANTADGTTLLKNRNVNFLF